MASPTAKHRLYLPGPLATGQVVALPAERAHYLTRVLRVQRDQLLECFDGSGQAWLARLQEATRRSATLALEERCADTPAPTPAVHLVQGLLKGNAMDLVVQKATELGATDLWPVRAARSNVAAGDARETRKLDHWQRVIISAAEQCGALHLPRLHPPRDLADWLAEPPPSLAPEPGAKLAANPAANLILLDPEAPPLPVDLPHTTTCLLVGPEGGFSDSERAAAAAAGAQRYGLGSRILRGETVPLAALAALRHGWGWC